MLLERVAQSAVESAREQTAERLRLNKHLIELATSIGSVKELRLLGGEGVLLDRQRSTWDEVTAVMWRSQLKAAVFRAIGQGLFALGYGGAIVLELASALNRHASIGDLVLVITLAVQVSVQVSGALGLLSLLQTAARTVERIEELRSIAASALGRGRTGRPADERGGHHRVLTRGRREADRRRLREGHVDYQVARRQAHPRHRQHYGRA
ncbi:hypothetical protein [Trebonia kvetii]|uniref:hypothetical protein n=1 Tax=Trebonia kvetii TaxID=2480626 RepID=UPI001FE2CF11|nr:hypothetical protein [Trebonia kvetii]